jgi:signal transduction histidine kinase/DNA-binding response OmpR family regulator/ligand-binding sensor domain-containing protein
MNFSLVFASPIKKFHQISREDGLSSDSVFAALEDENGFIWFATDFGLQRFDGNDFANLKQLLNEETVFASASARVLVKDKYNNIWIGFENGLTRFDPATNILTKIDLGFHKSTRNLKPQNFIQIRSLYFSEDNVLWVGSYKGLTRYNTETASVKHFEMPPVRAVKKISHNKYLIGTLGSGLYVFSSENGKIEKLFNGSHMRLKYRTNANGSEHLSLEQLSTLSITNIYSDNSRDIFISTWGLGLLHLNSNLDILGLVPINNNPLHLQKLIKDRNDNYWLTTNNALYFGEKSIHNLKPVSRHTGTEIDFANGFRDISLSKSGKLTAATFGFGIFIHDIEKNNFESFRVPENRETNNTSNVLALEFIDEDLLAIGSNSDKIWLYHTKNQEFDFLPTLDIFSSLGVLKINKVSPGVLRVHNDWSSDAYTISYNENKLSVNSIQKINQEKYRLISGIEGKLVLGIDEESSYLSLLAHTKDNHYKSLAESNIKISPGSKVCGCLWLKNDELILAVKGMPVMRLKWKGNKLELLDSTEFSILSNSSGIYKYNDNEIIIVTKDQGVLKAPINRLKDIVKLGNFDKYHSLLASQLDYSSSEIWLATYDGLLRFNISTQEVERFDEFDGLNSNEFNWPSIRDKDGYYYFGGSQGFIRFRPENIVSHSKPLRTNLTKLIINSLATSVISNGLVKHSIETAELLNLKYEQNNFALEFSSPTLPGEQKKLTYAYILEGFESDWHYVDYKKRLANYTNVPHGDYVFRVKVQNKNGIWSEQDRTLAISISPPWWLTTWAYLAYILTVILIFYAAIQYRTKALTRRSKFLQKEVTARTKEVEQLLEKQNQEFANISHEFRTPLTLILGPISNVLKKLNPKTQSNEIKQLETTQRNSYRLLRMVDQLLNIESFQVKSIVQKQPIAFGETTRLIADGFKELAKEKNCEFNVEDIAQINFEFTPDAYEKILLNLLSNAFKYTPTNGKISLKTSVHGSEFILTVSDTGIGIPVEEQANIFERFNRSTNVNQENAPGAGIGLSLVKSLVELHQGKIQLESQPQIGTTFTVTLPIVNPTNNAEFVYGIDDSLIDVELMTLAAQSPATSQVVSAAGDENTNRETILIIEDNDDMRHYIQESVSATYKVLTASDGEQGVSIAVQEIPDLIISDIMMPKLDGYQVTSQLRQHTATSHIPIILLTAKDDKVSRMKGWHERADEYLTKPFDVNELNIRIKGLLEIRDLLKQRFADSIFKTDAPSNSTDELENQEQIFIKNLNKVMEEFYTDHQIKISEISSKVAMSDRQLSRKLKSTVDMTPTEYLRKYRLERAKDLLSKGETVTNTAFQVGFTSSSYFTSCFKAHVGVKPSEFTSLKKA